MFATVGPWGGGTLRSRGRSSKDGSRTSGPRPWTSPTGPGPTGATARPGRRKRDKPTRPRPGAAEPAATPVRRAALPLQLQLPRRRLAPEELAEEAVRLGLEALALTDHDGFYGVVRFAEAARGLGLPTVFGAELTLGMTRAADGRARPRGRPPGGPGPGPGGLRPAGHGHQRGPDGGGEGCAPHLPAGAGRPTPWPADHWLVLTGCRKGAVPRALVERGPAGGRPGAGPPGRRLRAGQRGRRAVGPRRPARLGPQRRAWPRSPCGLGSTWWPPTTSTTPRPPAAGWPPPWPRCGPGARLDEIDGWLPAAAGAHLRSGDEQARRFARYPGAVDRAAALGRECAFDLQLVAPNLPPFPCPPGHDEMSFLRQLTEQGAARAGTAPEPSTRRRISQLDHELDMIEPLGFPGYFLVVWDIVQLLPGERASSARGGDRRPTPRSATPSGSPTPTP